MKFKKNTAKQLSENQQKTSLFAKVFITLLKTFKQFYHKNQLVRYI